MVCNGGQIGHLHVRRQRVKLRGARLVAVPHVHGQGDAQLLWQKLTELDGAVGVQSLNGLSLTLLHPLLQTAPTGHGHVGGDAHVGQVRQGRVGLRDRCPTAFFVESGQAQFVHPEFGALGLSIVGRPKRLLQILVRVSDADHDRDHVAQCRIALHRQPAPASGVDHRIHPCRRHFAVHITVSQLVQAQQTQRIEVDVDVVLQRPDVILVQRCHVNRRGLQRNLVLVVVLVVVASQPHKDVDVALVEHFSLPSSFDVDKHLETLVHPHVEVDVAVGGPSVAVFQATHVQRERLLVQTALVQVGGVDFLVDPRGNHVRHRLSHPVLFQVHGRQGKLRARGIVHFQLLQARQALFVAAPLATHQFDARETKGHRLAPALHEHPHEADGTEVADAIVRLLVLAHWNLELVPLDGTLFARSVGLRHGL